MIHDEQEDSDDTPREQRVTDSQRIAHVRELVPTPHTMYEVQLGDRVKDLETEVASLTSSRKFWRWIAGLGLPSLAAVMLYTADKVTSSAERTGRAEAKQESMQKEVDLLRGYIHELQRHAGMGATPVTSGRVGFNP
jgi:hypothetical protein